MSGRFIICDKTGQWVMALRWAGGSLPIRIYETRSLWDCRQELLQFPASFLVLEATTANLESVVQLVGEISQNHRRARVVVLAERGLGPWEALLHEAGALHVAFSPKRLAPLVRMAYRHLPAIVQPEVSLGDAARSRMPWRDE